MQTLPMDLRKRQRASNLLLAARLVGRHLCHSRMQGSVRRAIGGASGLVDSRRRLDFQAASFPSSVPV